MGLMQEVRLDGHGSAGVEVKHGVVEVRPKEVKL